jgi:tellurite methyltransferase
MPIEDAIRWNKRYDAAPSDWFASPRSFLVESLDLLPRQGLALDLAMGLGQNASLLVEHGLRVIGLDVSMSAVKGARSRTPKIMAAVVDLTNFYLPSYHFDVVLNFYYLQRSMFPVFSRILKPGGWLVFETLTLEMLLDQPDINRANLLEIGELRERFSDWDIQVYREGWMTSDHGNRKSVASLIARSRLTQDGTMYGKS